MRQTSGLGLCGWVCWLLGLVAGIVAYSLAQGAVGVIGALLVGLAVGIFIGLVLSALFCKAAQPVQPVSAPVTQAAVVQNTSDQPAAQMDDGAAARAAAEAKHAEETAAAAPVQEAVAPKAVVKQPAKPAAQKTAAKKTAAKTAATKTTKTKPSTAAAKPAPKAGGEKKPRTLSAPRKSGADNLKLISGVGPKLEQTLNELGFWHFDQIAKWGAEEIAWVDSRLRFKGRIERDDWMAQAKILAAGGETAFSKKSKKA